MNSIIILIMRKNIKKIDSKNMTSLISEKDSNKNFSRRETYLVSGDYGSGKSYFIKNSLLKNFVKKDGNFKGLKKVSFLGFTGKTKFDFRHQIFQIEKVVSNIARWISFFFATVLATMIPTILVGDFSMEWNLILIPIFPMLLSWIVWLLFWLYNSLSVRPILLEDINRSNLNSETLENNILYIKSKYKFRIFIIETDLEIEDPRIVDKSIRLPYDLKNITEQEAWFKNVFGKIIEFDQLLNTYGSEIVFSMMENLLSINNMNIRKMKTYLYNCKKNLKLYNSHNDEKFDLINLLYVRNFKALYKSYFLNRYTSYGDSYNQISVSDEDYKENFIELNDKIRHEIFFDLSSKKVKQINISSIYSLKFNLRDTFKFIDPEFEKFAIDPNFVFKKNDLFEIDTMSNEVVYSYWKNTKIDLFIKNLRLLSEKNISRIIDIITKDKVLFITKTYHYSYDFFNDKKINKFVRNLIPEFDYYFNSNKFRTKDHIPYEFWIKKLKKEDLKKIKSGEYLIPINLLISLVDNRIYEMEEYKYLFEYLLNDFSSFAYLDFKRDKAISDFDSTISVNNFVKINKESFDYLIDWLNAKDINTIAYYYDQDLDSSMKIEFSGNSRNSISRFLCSSDDDARKLFDEFEIAKKNFLLSLTLSDLHPSYFSYFKFIDDELHLIIFNVAYKRHDDLENKLNNIYGKFIDFKIQEDDIYGNIYEIKIKSKSDTLELLSKFNN